MIPELRRQFNDNYRSEKYRKLLESLTRACGTEIQFRVSETPCFFPKPLLDQMELYGKELVRQLVGNPEYMAQSATSIPPEFNVPNEDDHPLFVQVDFGLIRDQAGELQPRLVELQGFPSLYGYQALVWQEYVNQFELADNLSGYLSGLNHDNYRELLQRAIVADRDPDNVVLLELDPPHQKTLPDFNLTEKICGISTVDVRAVVKQGSRLHYPRGGKLIPIERIYNRVIVDELERKNISLPFDYRDDLEVEWAGHPNWYFRISKFSLPFLKHESLPKTCFLNELDVLPRDRENYLLKPLYSFAGAGIKFAPTDDEIAAIPKERRGDYVLQERMKFEPVIDTPHGKTQAELRIMFIWMEELMPVLTLVRMGRGKMMGVDHNRDLEWVGGSAALYPK